MYRFYFEFIDVGAKKYYDIKANSFREARNLFFNEFQNRPHRISSVWRLDNELNLDKRVY